MVYFFMAVTETSNQRIFSGTRIQNSLVLLPAFLKITDFGGAHFNDKDERALTGRVPKPTTYRSPEFDVDNIFSTLCDIWAMGCIFLESSTWYHGGPKYIKKFMSKRSARDDTLRGHRSDTFFIIDGRSKARVKDAVNDVSKCLDLIKHEVQLMPSINRRYSGYARNVPLSSKSSSSWSTRTCLSSTRNTKTFERMMDGFTRT